MLEPPLEVHGHKLVIEDGKRTPAGIAEVITLPKHFWFGHPNQDVDLAVLPVASNAAFEALFRNGFEASHIWDDDRLKTLSVLEDVTMCGAPKGLWDEVHGLPIFRHGTTATHPAVDHRGRPTGVVDVACFPGSSGSPICVINEGAYPNKRQTGKDGGVVFGNRLILLGLLYAGPVHNARGEIEPAPLPSKDPARTRPVVPQMIHLGYYVKARELLTIVRALESRPVEGLPK